MMSLSNHAARDFDRIVSLSNDASFDKLRMLVDGYYKNAHYRSTAPISFIHNISTIRVTPDFR